MGFAQTQPPSRYSEPRFPKERIPMWKQVEEAVGKGLPKTAIEKLDLIIEQTLRDQAYPESALAIARKIRLQSDIQGGNPAQAIELLGKEFQSAPDQVKPALQNRFAHKGQLSSHAHKGLFQRLDGATVISVPPYALNQEYSSRTRRETSCSLQDLHSLRHRMFSLGLG
jgi:hypothetical protein